MNAVPCLTVRQPWGWAIAHAGKNVENRTWSTSYRGRILIHAGKARPSSPDFVQMAALTSREPDQIEALANTRGAVIAQANLIDCHRECAGCSPWAMGDHWHWLLADVKPLTAPVTCAGKQGLWYPDADTRSSIQKVA